MSSVAEKREIQIFNEGFLGQIQDLQDGVDRARDAYNKAGTQSSAKKMLLRKLKKLEIQLENKKRMMKDTQDLFETYMGEAHEGIKY